MTEEIKKSPVDWTLVPKRQRERAMKVLKSIGRPSKYTEEACDILAFGKSQGWSNSQVMAELGICQNTFYLWLKEHEEFSHTYKKAVQLQRTWFDQKVNEHLDVCSPNFSSANFLLLEATMKRRLAATPDPVDLPGLGSTEDTWGDKINIIFKGIEDGSISCEQAQTLLNGVKLASDINLLPDLEARLAELENNN